MTGKIAEITPERIKEVDEWVNNTIKPIHIVQSDFAKLLRKKNVVVLDEDSEGEQFAFTHFLNPMQSREDYVAVKYYIDNNDEFTMLVQVSQKGITKVKHEHDKLFHVAFLKALTISVSLFEDYFGSKSSQYKHLFKFFEAYRTWVNVNALAIKQHELPGITADLPQSLPVITDELPEVKQHIPDWIKALKPGESVWVGHTDHSKWEFPDGYRMYFELEQFQSLDDDIVLTNKSSCHNSYIYPTDVRFQFLFEGINYISAEPFHYEEFITTIDFLKGGKEVKLSKYTDKKRAHEILTLDLHFKWFELLKNKPKGKVKSKSTPKKEMKEVETPKRSADSVPLWCFSAETAMEMYAKAVGEDNAELVLKPFLEYSKNDEGITFDFPEDVKMCCTYCDEPIPFKSKTSNSWLVSNQSDLFYLYCIKCAEKRYIPFKHTAVRLELESAAQKPNELAAPGSNFRERYNNKKMRNRLIKQLEEMPTDRRAYLIESIHKHFSQ